MKRGRSREASAVQQANRAAAVGRLMLGKVRSWNEYTASGNGDLESLPRKSLRSGMHDVRTRMSNELHRFCDNNFSGMSVEVLARLYTAIVPPRGLRIPLSEFETKYAPMTPRAKRGSPPHATVALTLWGLQFEFPEDHLSKDLIQQVRWARAAHEKLATYDRDEHDRLREKKDAIGGCRAQVLSATRGAFFASFSLLEAYFAGLGWDALRDPAAASRFSEGQRKILDGREASLRSKVMKVPAIVTGNEVSAEYERTAKDILDWLKPFRDSVAHPSPFAAPDRFGGYDKLANLYSVDVLHAEMLLALAADLLMQAHRHVRGDVSLPQWLEDLDSARMLAVLHGRG